MPSPKAINAATEINPIDLYWRDIKDSEPLSREREIELFRRAHAGDKEARQALVTANLRFVVSVAREYREYGLSLIELISEGNVGLIEAIGRFDETRGFKFITYAVWWIRQAILKALAENGRIANPPMSQINDLQKIEKESESLAQMLGRSPTYEEIADHASISGQRTRNALQVGQADVSLDAPAYPDDDTSLINLFTADQIPVDDEYERDQMKRVLHSCLTGLDPREYQILRAYFGLEGTRPMTLEEIGESIGVTRERVRQLRNRALGKVRDQHGHILAEFSNN